MYGYGMDMSYIMLMLVTAALGMFAQAYINKTYAKWSQVPSPGGRTGAEMARTMLQTYGAGNVGIERVAGRLTDHYDPSDNNLHLSDENLSGGSVASVAVACHEAGHAVQFAQGYAFGNFRTALVPVVNISMRFWSILFFGGVMLNMVGLIRAAVVLYAFSVAFHLITLPVEIDASRRAVAYLDQYGTELDTRGSKEVLTAAALTYVAAALSSLIQLLYLMGQLNRRSRR